MTTSIPAPKTAKAADHPCELYTHDGYPRPTRTQYHHRHPVYLQNRVYGQIRDQDRPDMLWLCGLCHDSVHDWVSYLLGEAREPYPHPGRKAKQEAERTVAWYRSLTGGQG